MNERMTDAPARYIYKAAPLGPRIAVHVETGSVVIADAGGGRVRRTFSLHRINRARWSETRMLYAGTPSIASGALSLRGAGGALILRRGDWRAGTGREAGAFLEAVAAVLAEAARLNPGLEIAAGPGPQIRWLMAAIAAFTALFALLALLGAASAVAAGSWLEALVFLAAALGAGASSLVTALSFNPFATASRVSAAALAAELLERAAR